MRTLCLIIRLLPAKSLKSYNTDNRRRYSPGGSVMRPLEAYRTVIVNNLFFDNST